MIYYFSSIANDESIIRERNIRSNEAGKMRTLFLARLMNEKVTIMSLGNPEYPGFFKSRIERLDPNISIYYFSAFNYLQLKFLYYFFEILACCLLKVRRNDRVIVYNLAPIHILPIFISKLIKNYNLIIQIEELYSVYNFNPIKNYFFKLAEKIGVSIGSKYLISNSFVRTKIKKGKKSLVSFGYLSQNFSYRNNKGNKPSILYSGRLDYEGGIDIFLESINFINQKVKVYVTGVGAYEERVKKFQPDSENIDFKYLGFIARPDYERLLSSVTICVNPIRVNHAFSQVSFPSKIFQYLECGKIIVSSQIESLNDIPEYLREYIFCYSDDNPISLANKILEALKYPYDHSQTRRKYLEFMNSQIKNIREFMFDGKINSK